jgi:hypothetical protein
MCQQCGNNTCGSCQPIIPSGINGVDGINAFNFTTASFTMPAVNSNVTVNVKATNPFKNSWFAVGQVVFIETAGYFQVVSIAGSNQVTLENLGYSDANFTPAAPATTIASNVKVSPAGLKGSTGSTGGTGTNGTTRIVSLLLPENSGVGATKTFLTIPIDLADMPTVEGSALILTFNVKTNNIANALLRMIGIRFGGIECLVGFGSNMIPISGGLLESQFTIEIIRNDTSTEAYVRLQINGIDVGVGPSPWNESNFITGLNYGITNSFVVYGIQNASNTFTFTIQTVDKITA